MNKPITAEWVSIEPNTYRLKVIGGWLVKHVDLVDIIDLSGGWVGEKRQVSTNFVPDPKHEWGQAT